MQARCALDCDSHRLQRCLWQCQRHRHGWLMFCAVLACTSLPCMREGMRPPSGPWNNNALQAQGAAAVRRGADPRDAPARCDAGRQAAGRQPVRAAHGAARDALVAPPASEGGLSMTAKLALLSSVR